MQLAFSSISANRLPTPARRRLIALLLAIVVELLLLIVLLTLNAGPGDRRRGQGALSFTLIPIAVSTGGGGEKPAKKAPPPKRPPPSRSRVDAPPIAPPLLPPPRPVPPPAAPKDLFPDLLRIDRATLAASDIAKLPAQKIDRGGADTSNDSALATGSGKGPGGEPLYNAEWVREPTPAELSFYVPRIQQDGWALIACKTAPENRVENCVLLGESPAGSGLSRGFREAAWQFRIHPPRVGGKKLIGAWVRIFYQLTVKPAK